MTGHFVFFYLLLIYEGKWPTYFVRLVIIIFLDYNLVGGQSWCTSKKCDWKSTGCGFDPHSRKWNIYLHLYIFISSLWCRGKARGWVPTLNMTQELSGKWETECLNSRFPLPILLCTGYRVKMIFFKFIKLVTVTARSFACMRRTIIDSYFVSHSNKQIAALSFVKQCQCKLRQIFVSKILVNQAIYGIEREALKNTTFLNSSL